MDAYKQKVINWLNSAKHNDWFTIDRICEKVNQPRFIQIIKEYMNQTPWQGGWEFNHDYSKVRRIDLNFNKPEYEKLKQYQ